MLNDGVEGKDDIFYLRNIGDWNSWHCVLCCKKTSRRQIPLQFRPRVSKLTVWHIKECFPKSVCLLERGSSVASLNDGEVV